MVGLAFNNPLMNFVRALVRTVVMTILVIPSTTAQIRVLAVTDSATFTPGLPYVGPLATVFCTGLTGIVGVQAAREYPLPYEIAGVSVNVSGGSAPLLAVADLSGYQQINIQMPYSQGAPLTIEVSQFGQSGQIPVQLPAAWGVFFTDSSGYAVAQHADYSLITPSSPAHAGEAVILICYKRRCLMANLQCPVFWVSRSS